MIPFNPEVISCAKMADDKQEVSKNALKKQQKAEEAAKKKAAKDAEKAVKAAEQPAKAAKLGGDDAEEMDPTQYYDNRLRAITSLEEAGQTAFPHKFHTSLRISEYIAKYSHIPDGEHIEGEVVSIAGRALSKRGQGKL
ncbi:hypothetical protein EON64_18975, partial [archaeon]